MRRLWVVAVLAGGCTHPYELDAKKVQAVTLRTTDGKATVCVGGATQQLQAEVVLDGGKRVVSWVPGLSRNDLLETRDFRWSGDHAAVDKNGVVMAGDDPVANLDKPIAVRAALVDRPEMVGVLQLAPKYDCGVVVNLDGMPGKQGRNGLDGNDGADGYDATGDGTPGNGANGGDGDNGHDGEPGGPGPAVDVAVSLLAGDAQERAVAKISTAGRATRTIVFSLKGPPLAVSARGGEGGRGGHGGAGGHGGKGGTNTDSHATGMGGSEGSDGKFGQGADGGPGGIVTVHYEAGHPELKEHVFVDTKGGAGGAYGGSAGRDGAPAIFAPMESPSAVQ